MSCPPLHIASETRHWVHHFVLMCSQMTHICLLQEGISIEGNIDAGETIDGSGQDSNRELAV